MVIGMTKLTGYPGFKGSRKDFNPCMKLNGVIPIRKANFIDPSRASMYSKISNSKLQIPNKSQISISKDPNRFVILNCGHCDLFVILLFMIFNFYSSLKVFLTRSDWAARGVAEI